MSFNPARFKRPTASHTETSWQHSSLELAQGLDVGEADLDTVPAEWRDLLGLDHTPQPSAAEASTQKNR